MAAELATTNGRAGPDLAHAGDYTPDKVALIKRTICQGASDDELALFIGQCKRTGLDPFSRQIHAVKRWNGKLGREVMAIQVGIDGFRLIADRTGAYAGNDDPVYDREDGPHPGKATVTVWKMVAGQRVPFTRSARWAEFVQTDKSGKPNTFWQRMPYLMLAKCAESLALRAAFPQELSGLYTSEEMGGDDDPPADPLARSAAVEQPQPAKPAAPAASAFADLLGRFRVAKSDADVSAVVGTAESLYKARRLTDAEWDRLCDESDRAVERLARESADDGDPANDTH